MTGRGHPRRGSWGLAGPLLGLVVRASATPFPGRAGRTLTPVGRPGPGRAARAEGLPEGGAAGAPAALLLAAACALLAFSCWCGRGGRVPAGRPGRPGDSA